MNDKTPPKQGLPGRKHHLDEARISASDKPIHRLLDQVSWRWLPPPEVVDDGLYATHEGELEIGSLRLKCYKLNDGQRVFDGDDVARVFGPEFLAVEESTDVD